MRGFFGRAVRGPWFRAGGAAAMLAVVLVLTGVFSAGTALAQTADVTITPASATTPSGQAVTYTMSVTCSVSGGCNGTTVTFPSTAITGDGSVTDFGSWVSNSSCSSVTKTVSGGVVTFTYGNIPTGTSQCTFTVTPPYLTTANGTVVTITPTINGGNFPSSTGSPATLHVTASSAGTSLSKQASVGSTGPGGAFYYKIFITCPSPGGLATSAATITDPLPANFTYVSASTTSGTVSYDPATRTVTMTASGNVCLGVNHDMELTINGTATSGGAPDTPGTSIVNTASSSITFSDGSSITPTSTLTVPVVNLVPTPFLAKSGAMADFASDNKGQYTFNGTAYAYTFPGNWSGSGTPASYLISLKTSQPNAGVGFAVQDPLPCLTNLSGGVYTSNAPGVTCANPAFIPTVVTASGFTPTASDAITVIRTDGTTGTIAYSPAAGGWPVPVSPAVSEIDLPQFPEEGSNTSTTITFTVKGYAAPTVTTPSLLTNTATANAYLNGDSTTLVPQETFNGSVMVASPDEPSGTVFEPYLAQGVNGTACTASVSSSASNQIEIAAAPSQAIYLDYLAPAGATVTSGTTATFTATGLAGTTGGPYTTSAIPATVTTNFNGTGRTLLQWVIPAGTITAPGYYNVAGMNVGLALGAGCAGVYVNDVTMGYGAPVTSCITNSSPQAAPPPWNPTADTDLDSNATPLTGNYCGYSLPFTINPINPAFSVTKTAQGNLDAAPVAAGGTGDVSPANGTATYDVTFANTGATNLVDPVLYDILPAAGDTFATSTSSRGSQFGVTLTGVGPVPPGVTVYYSTAANPCRPQVLPTNPGCVNDWSTTPPSPLSSVTALEFAYAGTVYVTGGNGPNSISVPFTVAVPSAPPGDVAKNTVGATAMPGAGEPLMTPAESSVTGLKAAVIGLVKSASPQQVTAAGQVITYNYDVTNTTGVTLSGLAVTDTQAPPAGGLATGPDCPNSTLAPGASETCTATYTVTQADITTGGVTDSATAQGTPPTGGPVPSLPSGVTVPVGQVPALSVVKSAPSAVVHAAGDVVGYSFAVTNNGNVTLTAIAVSDVQAAPAESLDGPVTCLATTLAPGASTTCSASYTVTQADVDNGSVDDTATASGSPPTGPAVTSPPSSVSVPIPAGPAISIVKSATPSRVSAPGDVVTYEFTVTNTGNQTLTSVAVTDAQAPPAGSLNGPVTCPVTTLAPGSSVTCAATYSVTQADIENGDIDDTATASGSPPSGPAVTSPPVSLTVTAAQAPALSVVKSTTTTSVTRAGQKVPYSFLVTNTGNVTMRNVAVTDTVKAPSDPANLTPVTCPGTTLAPSAQETCTATYTATQADVDHGSLADSATVTGIPPTTREDPDPSPLPPSSSSAVTVAAPGRPGIAVVKTGVKDPMTYVGEQFRYSFLVTNTGNVTLRKVGVTDTVAPPSVQANLTPVSCPRTTLAPAMSMTCTATYTATAADVAHGSLGNTAVAYGTPPSGPQVRSQPHTISVTVNGGTIVIPTGEGAGAAPGTDLVLAAGGAVALAAGLALPLALSRRRRRPA